MQEVKVIIQITRGAHYQKSVARAKARTAKREAARAEAPAKVLLPGVLVKTREM
jgi:hypothetical protein